MGLIPDQHPIRKQPIRSFLGECSAELLLLHCPPEFALPHRSQPRPLPCISTDDRVHDRLSRPRATPPIVDSGDDFDIFPIYHQIETLAADADSLQTAPPAVDGLCLRANFEHAAADQSRIEACRPQHAGENCARSSRPALHGFRNGHVHFDAGRYRVGPRRGCFSTS